MLDDKVKECIFLGYGHEEFRYRLRNAATKKKLIRSKDVFLEDQIIGDKEKNVKSKPFPEYNSNFSFSIYSS